MSGKYPGGFVTAGAPAGYSVAFDGSGDGLTIADFTNLDLSTGDFTVECWFYINSAAANSPIINRFNGNATSRGNLQYAIAYTTSGSLVLAPYQGTNVLDITFTGVALNQWHHCALVRTGNLVYGYLDGVRNATTQAVSTLNNGVWSTYIGNYQEGGVSQYCNGYVSNVRITKGQALYTGATYLTPTQMLKDANTSLLTCNSTAIIDQSNNTYPITASGNASVSPFTPFTAYTAGSAGFQPALGAAAPGVWTLDEATTYQQNRQWPIYDPYFNNTTLMLHGNSPTNLPTWLKDASTNNFALTINGAAKAASQTPFSLTSYPTSGSGFFNGTTDYLSGIGTTSSFNFVHTSSALATLEAWVYRTTSAEQIIFDNCNGTASNIGFFFEVNATNNLAFQVMRGATGSVVINGTSSGTVPLNTWTHVAVTYDYSLASLNAKFYINGVASGTANKTANTPSSSNATNALAIGSITSGSLYFMAGYISNARIANSIVYTGAFTPSTAPLTAVSGTTLLTLQNSQPTNNSSFIDSSSNNFAVSTVGTPTQGTFSPFSQTGWSTYITSPQSNYITTPSTVPAFTGDFTIECWVLLNSLASTAIITSSQTSSWDIYLNSTGTIVYYTGAAIRITTTGTVPLNKWTHIAVVRSSGIAKIYINGVADAGTYNSTATIGSGSEFLYIGRDGGASAGFDGYISNYRLAVGVAVYNTNFTPPTEPLGATSGGQTPPTGTQTYLLTCQNNRFVDNSSTPKILTITGSPATQPFSPFPPNVAYTPYNIGGSGYFNGSTDFINGSITAIGTSDFTIEYWSYLLSHTGNNGEGGYFQISATSGGFSTSYTTGVIAIRSAPGAGRILIVNVGGTNINTTFVPGLNNWFHTAIVRNSGSISVYINGALVSTPTTISNNLTGTFFSVGGYYSSSYLCNGYISGFRVTNSALYTAAFPIPTIPPTRVSNTSLLLNYNNFGVIDNTAKNSIAIVGNAQISNVQSKWGGSSIYFDGTGDGLVCNSVLGPTAFGTSDFTIEFWIYVTNTSVLQGTIIDSRPLGNTSTTNQIYMIYSSANNISFYTNSAYRINSSAITQNTWYHVALVRASGSTKMYLNGTQTGATYADTNNYAGSANRPTIGVDAFDQVSFAFPGYLEDFRITKGIARYLANFTPPTSQLQSQ